MDRDDQRITRLGSDGAGAGTWHETDFNIARRKAAQQRHLQRFAVHAFAIQNVGETRRVGACLSAIVHGIFSGGSQGAGDDIKAPGFEYAGDGDENERQPKPDARAGREVKRMRGKDLTLVSRHNPRACLRRE